MCSVHMSNSSSLVHGTSRTMKLLLVILLVCAVVVSYVSANATCRYTRRDSRFEYQCSGLTNFAILDKARVNTSHITISPSNVSIVPSHTFTRFGATLVILDLHSSGIETIEPYAFVGLTNLEQLILWGNKLKWVPRDWFANTYNLRTLDISFNLIQDIDFAVYQILPRLENFYFDNNQLRSINFDMFNYLGNLKRVRFGRNPLNWAYRARLTWQLENQHVAYTEEWEDWAWMNAAIKRCIEDGRGEIPSDTVLDCVVETLLDFAYESVTSENRLQPIRCGSEAQRLVRCVRPRNNTRNNDSEALRIILEDYVTILPRMSKAQGLFSLPTH